MRKIIPKDQAYEDYLDCIREQINNDIKEANKQFETIIEIDNDTPKAILDELEENGYTIKSVEQLRYAFGTSPCNVKVIVVSWGKDE